MIYLFIQVDDVTFKLPVDVGALLQYEATVAYTEPVSSACLMMIVLQMVVVVVVVIMGVMWSPLTTTITITITIIIVITITIIIVNTILSSDLLTRALLPLPFRLTVPREMHAI